MFKKSLSTTRLRRAASSVAVAALCALAVPTTASAAADTAETASQQRCAAAATEQAPESGSVRFGCAGALLTTTTTTGGQRQQEVTNMVTGESVDTTGLSQQQRAQRIQEVRPSADGPHTLDSAVVDKYHAYTQDNLVYGTVEGGTVTFVSEIRMRSVISLQQRHHRLEIRWTQKDNREVTIDIPARINRDVSFWFDETVDTALYGGTVYQTQRTEYNYMMTAIEEPAGVFYWELYNMKIHDRYEGNFDVAGAIEGPHFKCYKTVPCKYPNGEEA